MTFYGHPIITKIRLWKLIALSMLPMKYAGNYDVYKFLGPVAYRNVRAAYWEKHPQLPGHASCFEGLVGVNETGGGRYGGR